MKVQKALFFVLFAFSFLKADELDTLLKVYEKENDLSTKTKKEAAGNVIVYTREDLEAMKVESFSELLKSIPYYRYNEDSIAFTNLSYSKYTASAVGKARLYINGREITTPFLGSSNSLLSKLDFGYVDHVEIYYGATSFEFGVEPAEMIINIYTKEASRENGGEVRLIGSSYGSKEGSISYAKIFDNFSVYTYANKKVANEKKLSFNNTPLSRDKESDHLFLSFQNEHNRIEYNRMNLDADIFVYGENSSPLKNNASIKYDFFAWHSNWLNKKLYVSLDYISSKNDVTMEDDQPLMTGLPLNKVYMKNKEYSFNAAIKYKESIKNHDLLVGTYFRKKSFKNKESKPQLLSKVFPYEKEDIYSVFLQDHYHINDNQILAASFKYDKSKTDNDKIKKKDLFFSRFGYIYTNDDFTIKTFYAKYDSSFDQYSYFFAKLRGNPDDIKHQENQYITFDFSSQKEKLKYNINAFFAKEKYFLTYKYKNALKPINKKGISFSTSYNFGLLNRIDTNFFIANEDIKEFNDKDTFYGASLRFFNTIDKFTLYNELIYRGGYDDLDDGYDLNSSITYKVNNDLSVFTKGQNILNKAIKTNYNTDIKNVPVSSRKFSFGLEYKF